MVQVKAMLNFLDIGEKEALQKRGYMFEHLLCFYSMVSEHTALYDENFPVYFNSNKEVDVILFGLGRSGGDTLKCVRDLAGLPIKTLNMVSPIPLAELGNVQTTIVDWDFQISVDEFDFDLEGNKYRSIRNKLNNSEQMGYYTRISREFTANHVYVMARHMASHQLDVWDYEELLSLERFLKEHDHGFLMEVYQNGTMVGFDFIDFFEDNLLMVVPLGIYLDAPTLSDFMMYENLKFAKDNGYEWVDVGPTCGSEGLRKFKEKWLAEPKFKFYVQKINLVEPVNDQPLPESL